VDQPVLRVPQHFINRELSALEFNQRVLVQSLDARIPLLERLRFLCISSAVLDEFFEIRVSGLMQLAELGTTQIGPDGMAVAEQLAAIHERTNRLVAEQYRILNEVLLPELASAGLKLGQGDAHLA
jgi:polyphosphate kinase